MREVRTAKAGHHGVVVGYVALSVALGGTAFAATQLPADSVGPRQLRAGAVTNADVKRGALRLDRLSSAARQAIASAGELEVITATEPLRLPSCAAGDGCASLPPNPAGTAAVVVARCQPGSIALAGGYGLAPGAEASTVVTDSGPSEDLGGWSVRVVLTEESRVPPLASVTAICSAAARRGD